MIIIRQIYRGESPDIFQCTIPLFVQKNVKNMMNMAGLVSSENSVACTSAISTSCVANADAGLDNTFFTLIYRFLLRA